MLAHQVRLTRCIAAAGRSAAPPRPEAPLSAPSRSYRQAVVAPGWSLLECQKYLQATHNYTRSAAFLKTSVAGANWRVRVVEDSFELLFYTADLVLHGLFAIRTGSEAE